MSNAGLIGSHTGVDGRGRLVGVAMAIAVAFSLVALSHAPAGAVEHEYEVASVGVDGERATYNQANDAYGNMQAFSPYSMAAGGTKVVFAKRQGYLPHHDGYVPLATDEWCGASGGCNDICIRDLVTNRTVSALSHLAVGNQHPWSYPGVGGAGQYWASSEDASTFLVSWYCYSEVLGGEVIGGTRFCTDPSAQPDDENALVLIDLDSGANEVLAVAKYAGFGPVDLSANGDRAIFAWGSYNDHATGPVKCFRPNWDCNPSSFDSVTVLWDRATGDLTAIANGTTIGTTFDGTTEVGDFTVNQARISGDGNKAFFSVVSRVWDRPFDPDEKHLVVYDVAKGTYTEIDLPWEGYGFFATEDPQWGWDAWGLIGPSHDGSLAYMTVGSGAGDVLARIDVRAATVRVFDDVICEQGGGFSRSVSFDGQYVGCSRFNTWFNYPTGYPLRPIVFDSVEGRVHEIGAPADGFVRGSSPRDLFVSSDGKKVSFLGHRVPVDETGEFGNLFSVQVYVTDAVAAAGPGPSPGGAGTFVDDDGSVFEADTGWMAVAGITKGCNPPPNDRFCPDGVVTRGQMAAFLVRALGLTDRLNDPFIDDDDSIFEADIERLAAAGITKGCNPPANDRFCPDAKVTRQVMAAFLVRALGYTDDGGGDLFTDDDGSVFEGDIDRLGTAGVTKGCNPLANTRFCPTGNVTRGQMAAFLHRALG